MIPHMSADAARTRIGQAGVGQTVAPARSKLARITIRRRHFRGPFSFHAQTITVVCMTIPPATDATAGDSSPAQPDAKGWIGIIPILIGVIGAIAFELYTIAVIGMMIFPALGVIIAGVVAVGSAVGIAGVHRARTGNWRPVASAVLALFPALFFWLSVFVRVPGPFGVLTALGPIAVGVMVGALATLTMPGRWKLVGAISAAVIAVTLVPIAIEMIA